MELRKISLYEGPTEINMKIVCYSLGTKNKIDNNNNNNNNNNHLNQGPPRLLPTGAPLRERHLPQFVGGVHHLQGLLFTPYPVIPPYVVRTPHPGITGDREHIHHELQHESPATPSSSVGPYKSAMRKAKWHVVVNMSVRPSRKGSVRPGLIF